MANCQVNKFLNKKKRFMNTFKDNSNGSKKLQFGFSTVNSGQRNSAIEPQFIAVSTEGGFRITAPVSAALGIEHGEYCMFISNVQQINTAILEQDPSLVEFCNESGLEIGTVEAAKAIHKEFDMWAIAKGIVEYDQKGNVREESERLGKVDRIKFVQANFDEMYAAALESGDEELVSALTREGVTKEEQVSLLSPFVEAKSVKRVKGSKVANPGQLAGAGVNLTFTDTNVWLQMKADLGENATKLNRVFDIDLTKLQNIQVSNGYELVNCKAAILGDYVDKTPSKIGSTEK